MFPHEASHLYSIKDGHLEIDKNNIKRPCHESVEALLPIEGRVGFHAIAGEQANQNLLIQVIIIANQSLETRPNLFLDIFAHHPGFLWKIDCLSGVGLLSCEQLPFSIFRMGDADHLPKPFGDCFAFQAGHTRILSLLYQHRDEIPPKGYDR